MKITEFLTDEAILAEIGPRIARRRLDLSLTQAALAREAGVRVEPDEMVKANLETVFLDMASCTTHQHIFGSISR